MREITPAVKSQLNLPDLLVTDIKEYLNTLHKIIVIRNQSYYQIGQLLCPIQDLYSDSPEAFKDKFGFDTFDEFLTAPIGHGGCNFQSSEYGKRMIHAMYYATYLKSILPSPQAERVYDIPYDRLERIESVENHIISEKKETFEKNKDMATEVTTMALTMETVPFRKNITDIRNGKAREVRPEPLSNNQKLAVAWGRLYTKVLDKQNEKGLSDTYKKFWKSLLIDMQEIISGIK